MSDNTEHAEDCAMYQHQGQCDFPSIPCTCSPSIDPQHCDCHVGEIAALKKQVASLEVDLQYAKDDLCRLDGACWYCLNPEIEDAWRHEHQPDGPHWHHCIDPGDGLPSDCLHSEMYERIWEEATEAAKLTPNSELARVTAERDELRTALIQAGLETK